jgi:hypothetical protein
LLLISTLLQNIFPSFDPQGLLTLDWPSIGISPVGEALSINDTSSQPSVSYPSSSEPIGELITSYSAPQISMSGTSIAEDSAGGPFNSSKTLYTILMTDANYSGTTSSSSLVRHWLVVSAFGARRRCQ